MENFNFKALEIEKINCEFTVCKIKDVSCVNLNNDFVFLSRTDEEISLVCPIADAPDDKNILEREDGWKAFRIKGVLDFGLIGILARISTVLAEQNIGIFAVSTFNTDYIFVKAANYERAIAALEANGCRAVR